MTLDKYYSSLMASKDYNCYSFERKYANQEEILFKLYEQTFGKRAYIAEPNGSKQQTINAIKKVIKIIGLF